MVDLVRKFSILVHGVLGCVHCSYVVLWSSRYLYMNKIRIGRKTWTISIDLRRPNDAFGYKCFRRNHELSNQRLLMKPNRGLLITKSAKANSELMSMCIAFRKSILHELCPWWKILNTEDQGNAHKPPDQSKLIDPAILLWIGRIPERELVQSKPREWVNGI